MTILECRPGKPISVNLVDSNIIISNEIFNILVFPNPFKEEIVLKNLNKDNCYKISILSLLGQEISNYEICEYNKVSINTDLLLQNNVYILKIEDNLYNTKYIKILKN